MEIKQAKKEEIKLTSEQHKKYFLESHVQDKDPLTLYQIN